MKSITLIWILCILFISAFAHEYVLMAYKYKVKKGEQLEMHLFVADGFNIQMERPLQLPITKNFKMITELGTTDLLPMMKAGDFPILNYKVNFEGLGLLHMSRDYARNEMPTGKFLDYLKEDHIENISRDVNAAKATQREKYTRYLKALIQSGKASSDTFYKTVTDQKFEIVLLQNPYLLHRGDKLKVQLLFDGKPLANKVLIARSRTGNMPSQAHLARTNKDGICALKLYSEGDWFIHATHMTASKNLEDSDWESYWTSYSFGVGN